MIAAKFRWSENELDGAQSQQSQKMSAHNSRRWRVPVPAGDSWPRTKATWLGSLELWGSTAPRLRQSAQLVVGVRRSRWRRGVGKALLSEAIRWAPTVGLSRLELFVMKTNSSAISLCEHLGFRVEGHRRRAHITDGAAVDDQLMACVFEA